MSVKKELSLIFISRDQTSVRVFVFGKSQFCTLRDGRQGPWWGLRKFYQVGEYLNCLE